MTQNLAGVVDADDVAVAVHEAGHAVVAILTGLAVRYATLAPRDAAGAVVLRPRATGYPAQETLAVTCAGMIAQDVVGTDERYDIVDASHAGDVTDLREQARAWHTTCDDATVLDLIARSWAMAHDLITAHYGAVLAVAQALLASRTALTGPQIRACTTAAPTVRPDAVPADARTFWVPEHSLLRNWGPAAARRRTATRIPGMTTYPHPVTRIAAGRRGGARRNAVSREPCPTVATSAP